MVKLESCVFKKLLLSITEQVQEMKEKINLLNLWIEHTFRAHRKGAWNRPIERTGKETILDFYCITGHNKSDTKQSRIQLTLIGKMLNRLNPKNGQKKIRKHT